jgi:hypothetical protein
MGSGTDKKCTVKVWKFKDMWNHHLKNTMQKAAYIGLLLFAAVGVLALLLGPVLGVIGYSKSSPKPKAVSGGMGLLNGGVSRAFTGPTL